MDHNSLNLEKSFSDLASSGLGLFEEVRARIGSARSGECCRFTISKLKTHKGKLCYG